MVTGDEYAVFQRGKLELYLRTVLNNKPDLAWLSWLTTCVALAIMTYKEADSQGQSVALRSVFLTVLIGGLIACYCAFFRSFKKWRLHRNLTAEHIIRELSEEEVPHRTHALLVIKRSGSDATTSRNIELLVERDPDWKCLLPYQFIPSTNDKDASIAEGKRKVGAIFNAPIREISHLGDWGLDNVIKFNPDKKWIMKCTHIFYAAEGVDHARLEKEVRERQDRKYEWRLIWDILNDPNAMKYNAEVWNRLLEDNRIASIPDSLPSNQLAQTSLPRSLKVIWNITNKCSYRCSFCATHRSKSENTLSFQERLTIMEHLCRIRDIRIDVSGGDPLLDQDARHLLLHVLKHVASKNITITSTGKAFDALDRAEQDALLTLCESFDISYDYPSRWDSTHRQQDYNPLNCERLKWLLKSKRETTVLVTLSKENTSDTSVVEEMIKELATEIKPERITLLRLMPVGRQSYDTYPAMTSEYNPINAITSFRKRFGKAVKLHCAFRASIEPGGSCNMLKDKIGLDHEGNAFACAWAGYLPVENVRDNPFFLGNIIESRGLEAIFNSKRCVEVRKLIARTENKGCRVFSYLASPEGHRFETPDPLLAQRDSLVGINS